MGRCRAWPFRAILQGVILVGLGLHAPAAVAVDEPGGSVFTEAATPLARKGNGVFVTTGTGVSVVLGQYSDWMEMGQAFRMELGRPVSSGWDGFVFIDSSLHNGADYEQQGAAGCFEIGNCIQGDTRFHKLGLGGRVRTVEAKTMDVYGRVIAGVGFAPLLMDEKYFAAEVVGDSSSGAWQGNRPAVHDKYHPIAGAGIYVSIGDFGSGVAPYMAFDAIFSPALGLSPELLVGFSYQFGGTEGLMRVQPIGMPEDAKAPEELQDAEAPEDVEVPEEEEGADQDDWRDW